MEAQDHPIIGAALAAGREIQEVYAGDAAASVKSDGSPVTLADEKAEAVILEALHKLFPDVPVVAEEAVEAGHIPKACERYFLVDPLDGTKEFISRNGEFTVNIALVDNRVPVFGVVYAPALGDIYWGGCLPEDLMHPTIAGKGVVSCKGKIVDGAVTDVRETRVRKVPESGVSVLVSRSHLSRETSAFLEGFDVAERISIGSSLKLCLVAEGRADLYPRLAPTMQWDIAAGDAVLRAAGGEVLQVEGLTPLEYRLPEIADKAGLRNPQFVATGSRTLLTMPKPAA